MEETGGFNPWLFELGFFFLRCGVPLLIALGISYLLRRFGLVSPPPEPPPGWNNDRAKQAQEQENGGVAHAKS